MSSFYLPDDQIAADYIRQVLRIGQQQGLGIAELLAAAGLDVNPLEPEHRHLSRLPARHYEKLCRTIAHKLKQFSFGDSRLVDSFAILCHCIESAPTLGEALRRIEKFINLTHIHGQPMRCRHDHSDHRFHFAYVNVGTEWSEHGPLQLDIHILFFWHRLFCWLIDELIDLQQVRVSGHPTAGSEGLFNCDIVFDAEHNCLVFDERYLEKKLVRQQREFADLLHHSEYNFFLVTDSLTMPVAKQVELLLNREYRQQLPALEVVADCLHMSVSSLRRRLRQENTPYQDIKDRIHMQRAVVLLQRKSLSLADVADQLGFTDSSGFQRSFKRWTGQTPGQYRQRLSDIQG